MEGLYGIRENRKIYHNRLRRSNGLRLCGVRVVSISHRILLYAAVASVLFQRSSTAYLDALEHSVTAIAHPV
jgi:hypothetical protein